MSVAVSVVIPTFNRPALLTHCLAALLRQDFDPERLEIVIVVDGPDPATVNLVKHLVPLSSRTITLCLQANRGPASARNAGWQLASGELILFTDDDCLPAPHWISSYWDAYRTYYPQAARHNAYGKCLAFRGPVHVPCPPRPTDYEKNTACLESAAFVTANCACTPAALRRIGGFDEAFTMAWREDSDLEFKLIETGIPIVTVPRARLTHPVRSAPWGISLKEQKKSLFNALLYKKHPHLFRRYIYRRPFWNYYTMILLVAIAVTAA
jgi:GT2 family glycosyltransferase